MKILTRTAKLYKIQHPLFLLLPLWCLSPIPLSCYASSIMVYLLHKPSTFFTFSGVTPFAWKAFPQNFCQLNLILYPFQISVSFYGIYLAISCKRTPSHYSCCLYTHPCLLTYCFFLPRECKFFHFRDFVLFTTVGT